MRSSFFLSSERFRGTPNLAALALRFSSSSAALTASAFGAAAAPLTAAGACCSPMPDVRHMRRQCRQVAGQVYALAAPSAQEQSLPRALGRAQQLRQAPPLLP